MGVRDLELLDGTHVVCQMRQTLYVAMRGTELLEREHANFCTEHLTP